MINAKKCLNLHLLPVMIILAGAWLWPAHAQTRGGSENTPVLRGGAEDRLLPWHGQPEWHLSGAGNAGLLLSRLAPKDIVAHPTGRILLLDQLGRKVYVISPTGLVLDSLGRSGSGHGEFRRPLNITTAVRELLRHPTHRIHSWYSMVAEP
jgi:hypothetical protein